MYIVSEWKEIVTLRWHVTNHVDCLHSDCMYIPVCNSDCIVSVIYSNVCIIYVSDDAGLMITWPKYIVLSMRVRCVTQLHVSMLGGLRTCSYLLNGVHFICCCYVCGYV